MCAELPPQFRLVVKRNGEEKSQGTAWFVTRSKVITAWHVIECVINDMGELPGVSFELEVEGKPIKLEYVHGSEDKDTDVAVLHVRETDRPLIRTDMVLILADCKPEQYAKWSVIGFPKRSEGMDRSLTGEVTNPSTGNKRLELLIKQGTFETWVGVSGAALIIKDRVAGIVTRESGNMDMTVFARPFSAVEKVVPELKGRAYRLKYRDWFRAELRPPEWCHAYIPKVTVNESTLDPIDQISDQIAKRNDYRVWLIVGNETEGRDALLRRVADSFIQNDSIENEDCFNLPIWCSKPSDAKEPVDLLHLAQKKLEENARGLSLPDIEQIINELSEAMEKGRALFIVDDTDGEEIDRLRKAIIGNCPLLAGVSESVAAKINDAQRCRIAALSDEDRRRLAAHWLSDEQIQKGVNTEHVFLPIAIKPLDVSIWCRAQVIFERLIEGNPEELNGQTEGRIDLLANLIDCLLSGRPFADHPRSSGMKQSEEAKVILAGLAYLTLIDGVEEIEPTYIAGKTGKDSLGLPDQATVLSYLNQVSEQCGVLQKMKDNTYRFAHETLQEYMAASAMFGPMLDLNLEKMAEHAAQIVAKDQINKWSLALALRLDKQEYENDAYEILGTLLNYGLPDGYGKQLRNKSGPLSKCVCQAVLHTERLKGKKLRKALGWFESPDDWTGYRPDEWRYFEELLRYLDGLALRVNDDESLARLISRILREAKIIDIALIRYSLAKELKKRKLDGKPSMELEKLYKRERFYDLAGHSCIDCAKVKIDLRPILEGWFFMGAPESEERSWPNEYPRHRVRLHEYYMSRTEVTNEQYEFFDPDHKDYRLSEDHPEQHEDWASHPVVRVSWYEAWCFAEWMGMKLPTEVKWEKAARGFNSKVKPAEIPQDPSPYWFTGKEDLLTSYAWFKDNSHGYTAEVKKEPSDIAKLRYPFALGGLCGNVWEWCMDVQGFKYTEDDRDCPDPEAFEEDPKENVITNRVIRGGSYDSPAWNCRHAVRHYAFPTVRAKTIGFRLCKDPSSPIEGTS